MATKPKSAAQKKPVFAYSVEDDSDLGMNRFSSIEAVVKDHELQEGEYDNRKISVWQLVGIYEVQVTQRTLKEVK